ncbi:hypothetical protein AB8Q18_07720 [Neisseriaceae bacterium CLB008]
MHLQNKLIPLFLISTILLSGCSIVSDLYYEDCAVHPDYFKQLSQEEQAAFVKKCGGPPRMVQVVPVGK